MHCATVMHMADATPQTPTDLVGTAEVCRLLRCNPASVSRWVASGALTAAHKLPGKNGAFLFTRAEVDRFAAEKASA